MMPVLNWQWLRAFCESVSSSPRGYHSGLVCSGSSGWNLLVVADPIGTISVQSLFLFSIQMVDHEQPQKITTQFVRLQYQGMKEICYMEDFLDQAGHLSQQFDKALDLVEEYEESIDEVQQQSGRARKYRSFNDTTDDIERRLKLFGQLDQLSKISKKIGGSKKQNEAKDINYYDQGDPFIDDDEGKNKEAMGVLCAEYVDFQFFAGSPEEFMKSEFYKERIKIMSKTTKDGEDSKKKNQSNTSPKTPVPAEAKQRQKEKEKGKYQQKPSKQKQKQKSKTSQKPREFQKRAVPKDTKQMTLEEELKPKKKLKRDKPEDSKTSKLQTSQLKQPGIREKKKQPYPPQTISPFTYPFSFHLLNGSYPCYGIPQKGYMHPNFPQQFEQNYKGNPQDKKQHVVYMLPDVFPSDRYQQSQSQFITMLPSNITPQGQPQLPMQLQQMPAMPPSSKEKEIIQIDQGDQ